MSRIHPYVFVALCTFTMALNAPAEAATHYVSPGQSIQAAIDGASGGDQIEVAPGTYYEAIDFKGKAVRLHSSTGPHVTTINGNGAYHVVQCVGSEGPDTTLDGFTITGGNANGSWPDCRGAGMYNSFSHPTVTNCIFSENAASESGGGMFNDYCSPTVTNCTFRANSAGEGGGMYNHYCNTTVTNCTFAENQTYRGTSGSDSYYDDGGNGSPGGDGAGMYNNGESPTVDGCIFSYNITGAGGNGGNTIHGIGGDGGKGGDGAGVYNVDSSPNFTGCIFTENVTGRGASRGSPSFSGSKSARAGYGAGIYSIGSSLTVTDCSFTGNKTGVGGTGGANFGSGGPGGSGGGMHTAHSPSTTVTNCTFTENRTGNGGNGRGGAPDNSSTPPIGGNAGIGAGMCNEHSVMIITDCTFSRNTTGDGGPGGDGYDSLTPTGSGGDGADGGDGGRGAGMYNYYGSSTMTSCSFIENVTGKGGDAGDGGDADLGGVGGDGGDGGDGGLGAGMFNEVSTLSLNNCIFLRNLTGDRGARGGPGDGLFGDGSRGEWGGDGVAVMLNLNVLPSPATLTNCSFYNDSTKVEASIYSVASNTIVTNCIVWGVNLRELVNVLDFGQDEYTVTYNSDVKGGSGWPWFGEGCIDVDPMFVDAGGGNLQLISNASPCIDAGDNNTPNLAATDILGTPRVVDGTGDGMAIVDMGAYEFQGRVLNITQGIAYATIQRAIDGASNGDQIEVTPETYYEAVNFKGKAVRLYSSAGPQGAIIDGTGAYHVVKCISGEGPSTILEGFTITGGNANGPAWPDNCGAGMLNTGSPTVIDCVFTWNNAEASGGGMYNFECNPDLSKCIFTDNTAGLNGGGIENCASSTTVRNCIFIGNTASTNGGGMYNYAGSNPKVIHCTFSTNIGSLGGGMYNHDSNPTVTNCILWDDTPNEIYDDPGSSSTLDYCDVKGGMGQSWFGTGCIDADPCFVDSSADNLRPNPTSPCIDAGDNDAPDLPLLDFDGYPRVIDGDCNDVATVDMGAYEFNYGYMGDLDYNCKVDFKDIGVLGPTWQTTIGKDDYDPTCNINDPPDDYIDWRDLAVIAENWLSSGW